VVVISHAHPDHLDPASLRSVAGDPLVLVPRGLAKPIGRLGVRTEGARVGEPHPIAPGWTITSVPARHWRWPRAPRAAAVGYLIERSGHGGIYFAGDTGPYRAMREFADRVEVALLPVGSWGPHLGPGHLSPRTAAEVARDLAARVAIPIHWGTLYPAQLHRILGEPLREPANRFATWAATVAPDVDVRVLQPGEMTRIGGQDRAVPAPGADRPIASQARNAPSR
jgi:L-ascorbate metabolism protein UlaG (beta-lactamase superfamily)